MCLSIILGVFIPWLIIYFFGKDIIDSKKYRREEKIKIGDYVFVFILVSIILGLAAFIWWQAIGNWLDFPSLILQNYEVKTGNITNIDEEINSSSYKSWGYDCIYIDGEQYKYEDLDFDNAYQPLKFYYLKHSKYIVKAVDYNGNVIDHSFSTKKFFISFIIYSILIGFIIIKDRKSKYPVESKKTILTFISFNIIALLILALEAYDNSGKITAFFIVMVSNIVFHCVYLLGDFRRYI